jgi:predicted Zn finger-like uncharacterized protein
MIETVCPQCSSSFKVPDDWRGKRGRCKRCGASFQIAEAVETIPLATMPIAFDDTASAEPPAEQVSPEPPSGKESRSSSSKPRPLSKRLKKWWKRSRLSDPSTGGWQIAGAYAGVVVLAMIISLMQWFRYVQRIGEERPHTSWKTVQKEQDANISLMAKTSVFSLATLVCLPIPYGLWAGSKLASFAWLGVRGLAYAAWIALLPGMVPDWSNVLRGLLVAFLLVTAIGNLAGCVLLTRREEKGNVGQMVLGIALIVYSEAVAIGLLLTTGFPGRDA